MAGVSPPYPLPEANASGTQPRQILEERPAERPRQNTGRREGARGILTTEYTETVEPILKNTEKISVISVGERKRPFCVFQW
jgi:hypothetical protein